ncbi:phosphatidylserine synthase-like isoform X2 [Hydractinia symbiolongicarpus]|uniref:phosphatidylserine synthase-like isoform X2 n=1 Tax=Hydractinia symbiolongicarpus TaxID=13093 RepID=UPI00254E98B7|nr:phosphatidylserine synthase-like isoform X2 [Hydractinia symbiolongicarpus]
MAFSADELHELQKIGKRKRTSSLGSFTTSCDEHEELDPGEQRVEDVTIQFFYKPRTMTLLCGILIFMLYFAFARDADQNQHDNFWHGSLAVFVVFMLLSLLICPNGPFVRPHPAVWRLVLGASIVYTLCLTYALFQSYKDIIAMLHYFDPSLKDAKPDTENLDSAEKNAKTCRSPCQGLSVLLPVSSHFFLVYAEDCSFQVVWSRLDIFVVAHFLGWAVKALMLRHAGLLWLLSIMWEFTEIAFSHLLENFKECWWDSIILDVVICNGLGIHFGLYLCKKLEMREYRWESIKDIQGASKKIRRAVLQFTPVSWTEVRWFDPKCIKMRYTSLCLLCIIWQISELNTFFLKHVFVLPTGHYLNVGRVVLISLVVMPTLSCITFFEAILSVRHAKELFSMTEFTKVAIWIVFQMFLCFLLIYYLVIWREKKSAKKDYPVELKKQSTNTYNLRFKEDTMSQDYDGDAEENFEKLRKRKPLHRAAKAKR